MALTRAEIQRRYRERHPEYRERERLRVQRWRAANPAASALRDRRNGTDRYRREHDDPED
jgi:hypothetical protein